MTGREYHVFARLTDSFEVKIKLCRMKSDPDNTMERDGVVQHVMRGRMYAYEDALEAVKRVLMDLNS